MLQQTAQSFWAGLIMNWRIRLFMQYCFPHNPPTPLLLIEIVLEAAFILDSFYLAHKYCPTKLEKLQINMLCYL